MREVYLFDLEKRRFFPDFDPVGEQSRKSRWLAPKVRRCESKWFDAFELSPLFMMDEKYFYDGRRGARWLG